MAQRNAILAAYRYLRGGGLNAPHDLADDVGLDDAVAVWLDQLRTVTDDELLAAVRAYVDRNVAFWPSVGQIKALVPRRTTAIEQVDERSAYDRASPDTRREVLRRINEEIGWPEGDLDEARWAAFFDGVTTAVLGERAA